MTALLPLPPSQMTKGAMLESVALLIGRMNINEEENNALQKEVTDLYAQIDSFDESLLPTTIKAEMLARVGDLVGDMADNELEDRALQAEIDTLYAALDAYEKLPCESLLPYQPQGENYA